MTVDYNARQKVREECNHRSPFSRTQVLAALEGGEEGKRREWVTDSTISGRQKWWGK